jgi:hypothetical protein
MLLNDTGVDEDPLQPAISNAIAMTNAKDLSEEKLMQ